MYKFTFQFLDQIFSDISAFCFHVFLLLQNGLRLSCLSASISVFHISQQSIGVTCVYVILNSVGLLNHRCLFAFCKYTLTPSKLHLIRSFLFSSRICQLVAFFSNNVKQAYLKHHASAEILL